MPSIYNNNNNNNNIRQDHQHRERLVSTEWVRGPWTPAPWWGSTGFRMERVGGGGLIDTGGAGEWRDL